MKKIISLIAVTSILLMGLVSCNIETSRTFQGGLKIIVKGLPDNVKALSMWATPNEWSLAKIQEEADKYIVDVVGGTATFVLETYIFSAPLECQFVPMTSKDMAMNDATWWQYAFSGSKTYANNKNNIVYDFTKEGNVNLEGETVLELNIEDYGIDLSLVFKKRFNTDNFQTIMKKNSQKNSIYSNRGGPLFEIRMEQSGNHA